MCYFLYGSINEGANTIDLEKLKTPNLSFLIGAQKDILKDMNANGLHYRLTNSHCDCDTAIGRRVYDSKEISDLAGYIKSLKDVRKIKWVCLSKKWWDDKVEDVQILHIDDIDLATLLAELKEGCLYQIQLFRRY